MSFDEYSVWKTVQAIAFEILVSTLSLDIF